MNTQSQASSQPVNHTDVLIVGAGILGLATAYLAHKQGHSVRVVDASQSPVGSSIQNFGHACFTGQADAVQPMAMSSRRLWQQAAQDANFWIAEAGTYVPALAETEMQVLKEFHAHRGSEQVRLLSAEEIAEAIGNPQLADKAVGGAHLPLDCRVNPREAAPALANWLGEQGVVFNWGTTAKDVVDGSVATNRGSFTGDRVFVCPNYRLVELFPSIAERHELRVCSLAMALIERPDQTSADLAILTGTSLARYDGFASMPSVPALKKELAEREPELVDCVANLMATGVEDGVFVGDSHAYSLSPEPFISAELGELLLDKGTDVLGIEKPVVKQRWLGSYADSPTTNLILEHPDSRTTVMVVASGIGMTMSFGFAESALSAG